MRETFKALGFAVMVAMIVWTFYQLQDLFIEGAYLAGYTAGAGACTGEASYEDINY